MLAFGICKWPSTTMSTYMCADMSVLLAVVSGLAAGTMCSRIFTVVVYGLRTTLLFLNALEYRISLLPPNPSVCVCVCWDNCSISEVRRTDCSSAPVWKFTRLATDAVNTSHKDLTHTAHTLLIASEHVCERLHTAHLSIHLCVLI